MPSLKSSTKGGDTIALFATESRALKSALATLLWLAGKVSSPAQKELCEMSAKNLTTVLQQFPEPETTAK